MRGNQKLINKHVRLNKKLHKELANEIWNFLKMDSKIQLEVEGECEKMGTSVSYWVYMFFDNGPKWPLFDKKERKSFYYVWLSRT